MEYDEALKYISSGEAVLFAGSYFSNQSLNYSGETIPDSKKLREIFLKELGEQTDSSEDLKTVSQFALAELGAKKYGDILRKQFSVKRPSRDVDIISAKPWQAIFTTNYDNAIEKSRGFATSSPNSNSRKVISMSEEVYHINGAIDDLTTDRDDVLKLLLSNDSYIENSFISSPGHTTFVNSLIYAKAIFFVGYSVASDLDIARIITRSDLVEKSFFINGNSASRIEKSKFNQFGSYTGKTTSEFADEISKIKVIPISKNVGDETLYSLNHVSPHHDYLSQPKIDNDINSLIDKGTFLNKHVLNPDYIVSRWLPFAKTVLGNQSQFIMTVRAKIGNGKSVFMQGLAQYISDQANIFFYNGPADYLYRDLMYIYKNFDEPIVFIDNISESRNNFGVVADFYNKGIRFVIADRSPVLEQVLNTLSRDFKIEKDNIIDLANLDHLTRNEFLKWTQNIETYHLWGKANKKTAVTKYKSNQTFSKLLIEIFKSSGILSKYQSLFYSQKQTSQPQQRLVIAILVLNLLNSAKSTRLEVLLNILNISITEEMKNNPLLSEFIDFSKMEIINSSSILSQEILHQENIFSHDSVYNTILFLMRGLDGKIKSKENNSIQRALTSFSNLTLIFGGNRRNQATHKYISDYYSEIQKLQFANDNVFLFVQLTNSKIYAGDYALAQKYLSFAEEEGKRLEIPDDYQVVTTKINLYVEFSKKLLQANPEEYLANLEWSAQQVKYYKEAYYIMTLFSKLKNPNNGFLDAINTSAKKYKSAFYKIVHDLYLDIKLTADVDFIEKNHRYAWRSLKELIRELNK